MYPPESKRQRPMSCLRWRSSPVLRQATGLPHNGIFEDFTGLVLTRTATVIFPSKEMVVMAMFRAIQCTPMPDVRQLTSCSRKWAAERPRCLSLTVKEADSLEAEQAMQPERSCPPGAVWNNNPRAQRQPRDVPLWGASWLISLRQ